jgi:hypothetical protein
MTVNIHLINQPFHNWNSYSTWRASEYTKDTNYPDYLALIYKDLIISSRWHEDMLITFKSEAHYTWFLLQQ